MPSREDFSESETDLDDNVQLQRLRSHQQSRGHQRQLRARQSHGNDVDLDEDSPLCVSLMSPTASCVVIDSQPVFVEPRPQDGPEELLERSGAVRKTRSAMLADLLVKDKEEHDSRKENCSKQQGTGTASPSGLKSGKTSLKKVFSRSFSFLRDKDKDKDKPEESNPSCANEGGSTPSRVKSLVGVTGHMVSGSLSDSNPDDSPRRRTTFGRVESGTSSHSVHSPGVHSSSSPRTTGSMNRGLGKDGLEEGERSSLRIGPLPGEDSHMQRKHSSEDERDYKFSLVSGRGSTQVVNVGSSMDTSGTRNRHGTGSSEIDVAMYSEGSGLRSGHASSLASSDHSRSASAYEHKYSSPSMSSMRQALSVGSSHTYTSSPSESSLLSRRMGRNRGLGALNLTGNKTDSSGFSKLVQSRGLTVDKIIGRSNNGGCKVMVANESDGSTVAIKCMCEAIGEGVLHTILRREYELLSGLHHPNIVKARSFLECEDQCGLVMELCAGIGLNKYMPSWSEGTHVESMTERCAVFEQVASAISYLHDKRIAHRDLHAENVLVSNQDRSATVVKVVDFGSARRIDDAFVDGTDAASGMMFQDDVERRILPPERGPMENMLTSDVFALGLIAAGLVAKKPMLTKHVCKGNPPALVLCSSPSEDYIFTSRAENYLQRLLNFNPHERITAREALDTLPPGAEWFKLAATKMSL